VAKKTVKKTKGAVVKVVGIQGRLVSVHIKGLSTRRRQEEQNTTAFCRAVRKSYPELWTWWIKNKKPATFQAITTMLPLERRL